MDPAIRLLHTLDDIQPSLYELFILVIFKLFITYLIDAQPLTTFLFEGLNKPYLLIYYFYLIIIYVPSSFLLKSYAKSFPTINNFFINLINIQFKINQNQPIIQNQPLIPRFI